AGGGGETPRLTWQGTKISLVRGSFIGYLSLRLFPPRGLVHLFPPHEKTPSACGLRARGVCRRVVPRCARRGWGRRGGQRGGCHHHRGRWGGPFRAARRRRGAL